MLVLFDLDDTLCDYQHSRDLRLRRAFGEAFARSHAPRPDFGTLIAESIAIHAHGTEHFAGLLLRHGVTDPDAQEAARTWYLTNRFLGLRLFPDALSTLRTLRATPGVAAIGLVTNGPAIIQREKIALLGLDPEVDFCIISGEVGFEKPDPRIFAAALERGATNAANTVYVGDSVPFDMIGARTAGLHTIWKNPTGTPWPDQSAPPDAIIPDCRSVIPIILGMLGTNDPRSGVNSERETGSAC